MAKTGLKISEESEEQPVVLFGFRWSKRAVKELSEWPFTDMEFGTNFTRTKFLNIFFYPKNA